MKRTQTLLTCSILTAASLLAGCGLGKHEFKFDPPEGDTRNITVSELSFTTLEVNGNQMLQKNDALLGFDCTVTGKSDGNTQLECTFTNYRVTFDSTLAKNLSALSNVSFEDIGRVLEGASGETFSVTIAPDGVVRYVSASGLTDKLLTKAGISDQRARGTLRTFIDGFVSESTLRDRFRGIFSVYPPEAVMTGATWTGQTEMGPSGSTLSADTTFNLASSENGSASITESITIPEGAIEVTVMPGVDSRMTTSGSGFGSATVDVETGWPVAFESNVKLDGNSTTTITGMGSFSVPVKVSITTKVAIK